MAGTKSASNSYSNSHAVTNTVSTSTNNLILRWAMGYLLIGILCLGLCGCATSTQGLTKDQIADRERARAARVSFYSQLTAALIMGAANSQGFKK